MTTQDEHLKQTFPEPPMIAFKRQKNLRDFLIRAKLPNKVVRNRRNIPGMKRCKKQCASCPFVQEVKEIKTQKAHWKLSRPLDCQNSNIVYMIKCIKNNCNKMYIGETERTMNSRFKDHKGYVQNKQLNQPTGEHFNSKGHKLSDMSIFILEQIPSTDPL